VCVSVSVCVIVSMSVRGCVSVSVNVFVIVSMSVSVMCEHERVHLRCNIWCYGGSVMQGFTHSCYFSLFDVCFPDLSSFWVLTGSANQGLLKCSFLFPDFPHRNTRYSSRWYSSRSLSSSGRIRKFASEDHARTYPGLLFGGVVSQQTTLSCQMPWFVGATQKSANLENCKKG
jgi:hypothetical protein